MQDCYEKVKQHGEVIKGQFLHKTDYTELVIAVISPFDAVIVVGCDNHINNYYQYH